MKKMYVRHKVADFEKWKKVFEEVEPFRQKMGSSGSHVFRNNSYPNEVLVITDWDSKEQGDKFGHSPELREAMGRGGVLGAPEMSWGE
jgi:heme-degrading monooxygenase HmoA